MMTSMLNSNSTEVQPPKQKVGFLLGIGIFFLPFIFVWWLLGTGYSTLARIVGFGWLAVFLLAAATNSSHNTSTPTAITAPASTVAKGDQTPPNSATPTESTSKWNYSEDTDQMRGTKTRYASIKSENELTFDFPYKGGNATLMLRQRPKDGLNILLTVNGQFICNSFNDDKVAVKFDAEPIENFSCSEPSDGSTGVLFIENAARFVAKLKKSQSVTIEAQFFQEGPRQMQFDVADLEWK